MDTPTVRRQSGRGPRFGRSRATGKREAPRRSSPRTPSPSQLPSAPSLASTELHVSHPLERLPVRTATPPIYAGASAYGHFLPPFFRGGATRRAAAAWRALRGTSARCRTRKLPASLGPVSPVFYNCHFWCERCLLQLSSAWGVALGDSRQGAQALGLAWGRRRGRPAAKPALPLAEALNSRHRCSRRRKPLLALFSIIK